MYLKIIKQIELLKTGEEAGPQITTPKSFEGFEKCCLCILYKIIIALYLPEIMEIEIIVLSQRFV